MTLTEAVLLYMILINIAFIVIYFVSIRKNLKEYSKILSNYVSIAKAMKTMTEKMKEINNIIDINGDLFDSIQTILDILNNKIDKLYTLTGNENEIKKKNKDISKDDNQ